MDHSWEKSLILPSVSIKEAIQMMDQSVIKSVVIVDAERTVLGAVTDGDIRRGILKGVSLDNEVSMIMNTTPFCCEFGTERDTLVTEMNNRNILFIPLLKNNKVVSVSSLHGLRKNTVKRRNPVFIMAGGFGSRLRPLTDNCPKPMLKLGDLPILEIIINRFIHFGFSDFYISTHYMPEKIVDYFGDGISRGVNISYVYEETPLGTGGALSLLPDSLPKDIPLIVVNGDILTKIDYVKFLTHHVENKADVTMAVREHVFQVPYGVVKGEGIEITHMDEKPTQKFFINTGMYIVEQSLYKTLPKNTYIDMPSAIELGISKSLKAIKFPIHEYWKDIGAMEDYLAAKEDIKFLSMY